MGREQPTVVTAPNANRRQERARRARETVNKTVPDILRSSPRARHGIHKAELIVDPDATTPRGTTPVSSSAAGLPRITLRCNDTLATAARLSDRPFTSKRTASTLKTNTINSNVTVLNMASPLKPGGGFLDGANSQEEFLCARTTLYPSLWDSYYRLPEIGGVWTPDVMVFRDCTPESNELPKRDRFFVDVISAGMLRFPEVNRGRSEERAEGGCSCGVSYCDRDRELVTRKMKAVLRIAQAKGVEKLVLGAWGCGAYGNPVKEVAKIWRKVIAGGPRQRRPNAERWEGIKEIVFAIPDRTMLREFENAFSDVLATDLPSPAPEENENATAIATAATTRPADEDRDTAELVEKIQETELQLEQLTNARSKARLRDILAVLNRELAQGLAAKQFKDDDLTRAQDEQRPEALGADEDGEGNSMYHFDEDDTASDSSDGEKSELYEFRTGGAAPGLMESLMASSHDEASHDEAEDDEADDGGFYASLQPSPRFDSKTGWFSGSIDDFHGYLRSSTGGQMQASHGSPVLRPDSSGCVVDEVLLGEYLGRYEGTDVLRE